MFICSECDFEYPNIVDVCEQCGQEVEIEKIDPNEFVAVSAVTAQLDKGSSGTLEAKVGRLWNLNNAVSNDFINKIELKFRRKNKFHNFLTKDELPNSIPTLLRKYIGDKLKFKTLVQSILSKIKVIVSNDGRILSGLKNNNIIFIHYKTTGDESDFGRLLIVMVDKKSGFDFESVALTPKKLSPIDTDALRQAALFDLTLFDITYPDNNGESYVKFIQGKSKSDFFKDALGCKREIDNNRSIQELFDAIFSFANERNLLIPIRDKIEETVREFLNNKYKSQDNRSVTLKDIQKKVDSCLPEEHPARGQFTTFVNEKEYRIDDVFEPTQNAAKNASSFKFTDEDQNFTCQVRKSAVGTKNSRKPVKLDRVNRCLILPLSDSDYAKLDQVAGEE
ncbi:TPA: nucleoid-associated protein [Yersinia enterocolitica]|nr:nucleoid-associated protein [Yersinia enterocolitica]